ncbi:hypothetical protein FIBSPDRAFT_884756 [Athelia psychrophila]|uniref:Uncharacterized protein n=1 Tax=Athelia psychrophila TaxID=1759441 RepID=A0A166SR83_9AGAM|nr:hypothetical protein FIBSPDRAFT_884756 [Fibularhizoctonia sp. CBS 109695]
MTDISMTRSRTPIMPPKVRYENCPFGRYPFSATSTRGRCGRWAAQTWVHPTRHTGRPHKYLGKPLDSWAAYDEHISHYAATPGGSERSVIIVDIEPMVAQGDAFRLYRHVLCTRDYVVNGTSGVGTKIGSERRSQDKIGAGAKVMKHAKRAGTRAGNSERGMAGVAQHLYGKDEGARRARHKTQG